MTTETKPHKHTPGPWTTKGPSPGGTSRDDGGDYAIVQDGKVIAEAFHQLSKTRFANAEANARLIAAAPDLLAALEWYAETENYTFRSGSGQSAIDDDHGTKARAALARARKGET